jgi:hypothetical protein
VDMPNTPGVRNVPWQTYLTTVDAIEALTGYDLLALLPDKVEAAVEAGQKPPLGALDGPYAGEEGGPALAMSAAASLDPNGTIVSYAWDFGDGATATGPAVAHTYAQAGTYPVRLVVTDNDGLTDTMVTTATVANVAPSIGPLAGATLLAHQAYQASGAFADPGADGWTATVDYGDGSGPAPLPLDGRAFVLAHVYDVPGAFTVTVQISDGRAVAIALAPVTVTAPPPPPPPSPGDALRAAVGIVDRLVVDHVLGRALGLALDAQLVFARAALDRNARDTAAAALRAFSTELDWLAYLGLLSAKDAQPLRGLVDGALRAISSP